MARKSALGNQELEILRYVTDHAPVTVRQVAEQVGEQMGLARTTILTMMERLRKKGYLVRRRQEGESFEYAPAQTKDALMRNLVQDFVEKTLAGSVSPFVAYMSETGKLSDDEVADLRRLVDKLGSGKEG
jgi:predicted transcriptional regulator